MKRRRTFTVTFRLDAVIVEVSNVSDKRLGTWGGSESKGLVGAIENARALCLMRLTKEHKGMKLDHIEGTPRVVGVQSSEAWGG